MRPTSSTCSPHLMMTRPHRVLLPPPPDLAQNETPRSPPLTHPPSPARAAPVTAPSSQACAAAPTPPPRLVALESLRQGGVRGAGLSVAVNGSCPRVCRLRSACTGSSALQRSALRSCGRSEG